ncbi:1393_t:CDS:2, partial [Racocetra fulgida]
ITKPSQFKTLKVTLIQATPISYFLDNTSITSEDLPYSFPLMIYSVPLSLILTNLMMNLKDIASLTGKKNIESNVIVSYTNQNGQYNSLKENLKKTKDDSSTTDFVNALSQIKSGEPATQENSDDMVISHDIDSD